MLDNRKPWAFPGLHHFQDDEIDRKLFFGRNREIRELAERVMAGTITVLFGKSGNGKTSLINVGLKASLRQMDYLPVYARIFNIPGIPAQEALYRAVEIEAGNCGLELPLDWKKETLWETFFALSPDENSFSHPIVLILDQFEELFTALADRPQEQEDFIRQFADLVRGRLPADVKERYRERLRSLEKRSSEAMALERLIYGTKMPAVKVLISLREDYLALLEKLGTQIPKIYDHRYQLPSFSEEQAREAISNPPRQDVLGDRTFEIEDAAVEAIVRFLASQNDDAVLSERTIGLSQLQIVCRQLEEQMRAANSRKIALEDIGGEKGLRKLLDNYYQKILGKFPYFRPGSGGKRNSGLLGSVRYVSPVHSPRSAIRELCEDRLITAGGKRNSRHEDEIVSEMGVPKNDLEQLVDDRLLQREQRSRGVFYELSHDSLVPSLQTAGKRRKIRQLSSKITFLTALVFLAFYAMVQWVIPAWNQDRVIGSLDREMVKLTSDKLPVRNFEAQLYGAKLSLKNLRAISKYKSGLAGYFMRLGGSRLERADSVISTIKLVYPEERNLIKNMQDTLQQRRFLYTQLTFQKKINPPYPLDDKVFRQVAEFLDHNFATLDKDFRILEMQSHLYKTEVSGKNGNRALSEQFAAEAQRQRQLFREQVRAAIKIKDHQILRRGENGKPTAVGITLENNKLLDHAKIRINGRTVEFAAGEEIGGEGNRTGVVEIPPDSQSMIISIQGIYEEDDYNVPAFFNLVKKLKGTQTAGVKAQPDIEIKPLPDAIQKKLAEKNEAEKQASEDHALEGLLQGDPRHEIVKTDDEGNATLLRVKVPINGNFINARFSLNETPMLIETEGNEILRVGTINIPPGAKKVDFDIRAVTAGGLSTTRSYSFTLRNEILSHAKILAALKVKRPSNGKVDSDSTRFLLVLENSELLRNAKLYLNGERMKFKKIGGQEFRAGEVSVPPDSAKVFAEVHVVTDQGDEVSRKFAFLVERTTPVDPVLALEKAYYQIVKSPVDGTNESTDSLQAVKTKLDSAQKYLETVGGQYRENEKVGALWTDLTNRRKKLDTGIEKGAQTRIENQLRDAIIPTSLVVKGTNTGNPSPAAIRIPDNNFPPGTRVYIGSKEMSTETVDGKKYRVGTVSLLPAERNITLNIQAKDEAGHEVTRDFTLEIDRSRTVADVKNMLKDQDYFCATLPDESNLAWSNPDGKGAENNFSLQNENTTVTDHSTNLMWQQSGSVSGLSFDKALAYVKNLNTGGFHDWRLPTLREAMSLMEPDTNFYGLYLDSRFNEKQSWIWTADPDSSGKKWGVVFTLGTCALFPAERSDIYVRAVRDAGASH